MTVEVRLFSAGSCRHSAWLVESGPLGKKLHLPALVAVIRHPRAGLILFDTGYGRPLKQLRTWVARLYRLLLPFTNPPSETVAAHLESLGVQPEQLSMIFLSHFHPDHIGGLREIPGTPILHSRDGLAGLMACSSRRQARAAFFPGLLPDDLAARGRAIEDSPLVPLDDSWRPFTAARDLLGDGALLAVPLPGHADGQYGLLCRLAAERWVFLVADAAWTRRNIAELALPGWPAGALIGDPSAFRATLADLHELHTRRPDVPLVPSHCQESIEQFQNEQ